MLSTPNVIFDIYRGFNAAHPFPLQGITPAAAGLLGHLRHHVEPGRFGFQDGKIKWTHLLELDSGVDIRSAYNSWTGPAETTSDADTVLIKDYPLVGRCTVFYVALVQRCRRGQSDEHLRVYLDRLQPRSTGCFDPSVQQSCGACTVMPVTWRLQTQGDYANNGCSNCASLNNGSWSLDYVSNCEWKSSEFAAICSSGPEQGPVHWHLYHSGLGWRLALANASLAILSFDPLLTFQCTTSNTFTNPTWSSSTCSSLSSAIIERG